MMEKREDWPQYQIRLIDGFVSKPNRLLRNAVSLRQIKNGASQLVGPNGLINSDGDTTYFLSKHYL